MTSYLIGCKMKGAGIKKKRGGNFMETDQILDNDKIERLNNSIEYYEKKLKKLAKKDQDDDNVKDTIKLYKKEVEVLKKRLNKDTRLKKELHKSNLKEDVEKLLNEYSSYKLPSKKYEDKNDSINDLIKKLDETLSKKIEKISKKSGPKQNPYIGLSKSTLMKKTKDNLIFIAKDINPSVNIPSKITKEQIIDNFILISLDKLPAPAQKSKIKSMKAPAGVSQSQFDKMAEDMAEHLLKTIPKETLDAMEKEWDNAMKKSKSVNKTEINKFVKAVPKSEVEKTIQLFSAYNMNLMSKKKLEMMLNNFKDLPKNISMENLLKKSTLKKLIDALYDELPEPNPEPYQAKPDKLLSKSKILNEPKRKLQFFLKVKTSQEIPSDAFNFSRDFKYETYKLDDGYKFIFKNKRDYDTAVDMTTFTSDYKNPKLYKWEYDTFKTVKKPEVKPEVKPEEKPDLLKMYDVLRDVENQVKLLKDTPKTQPKTKQEILEKIQKLVDKAQEYTKNNPINKRLFLQKWNEIKISMK